jgi:hypothetical protein
VRATSVRLILSALIVALAACDAGSDAAEDPVAPPSTTVQEIRGDGAALAPGRYTFSRFSPRVSFTLGSGFEGGHTNPAFFDVFIGDAALAFASPGYLLDSAGKRIPTTSMSPGRALEVMRERGAFTAVTATTMTVGDDDVAAIEGVAREAGITLLGGPTGELELELGDFYRIAPVQVDDRLVLVIQQALEAPFAGALAPTEPVLATISFTG